MLSYRKLAMRVLGRPLHTGGSDSPRPASQRAAAFVLTAAMLTALTAPAFAETWDIEKGDITVKAGDTEGTNKVSQGTIIDKEDTDTVITGKSDEHTVTIDTSEGDVDVTFDDLKIDVSDKGEAAVRVDEARPVHILRVLDGRVWAEYDSLVNHERGHVG